MNERTESETCKLIVCRYDSDDPLLDEDTRKQLILLARGNLEVVFFGQKIMMTSKANKEKNDVISETSKIETTTLLSAVDNADLALFVYGGQESPSLAVKWQDYLAGWARKAGGVPEIVCLVAETFDEQQIEVLVTSPENAIIATEEEIKKLIIKLYTDKKFTATIEPLNQQFVETGSDFLEKVVTTLYRTINGESPGTEKARTTYVNPTIRVTFPPGCSDLRDDLEVEADEVCLSQIFGIRGRKCHWSDIDKALTNLEVFKSAGAFHKWAKELDLAVKTIRKKDTPMQLKQQLITKDGHVYRPQIQKFETYGDRPAGRLVIDVSFSAQIHDQWLVKASPEAAVAHNLTIAARIRHDIVGRFIGQIQKGKWLPPQEWAQIQESIDSLMVDGTFFTEMAGEQLEFALGAEELQEINKDFVENVYPYLIGDNKINQEHSETVAVAMENWSANNLKFFKLALGWYSETLGLTGKD